MHLDLQVGRRCPQRARAKALQSIPQLNFSAPQVVGLVAPREPRATALQSFPQLTLHFPQCSMFNVQCSILNDLISESIAQRVESVPVRRARPRRPARQPLQSIPQLDFSAPQVVGLVAPREPRAT